ncbi:PREDICTED: spermatogenesis-associated protein 31E1 [Propithecus coquereli]|uniref:spermatogenesis-associated protein 31E1 n=1 Tax=Propithecus coquereli TaxID=379532 RepID=UPI00063F9996|nr:PREDICTED: spermatogenesis-associated protein 31E1 [Propithecus coquereli]
MENYPFPLSSSTDTWLNPSSTSWMMDIILGILCGLGLFLLLLPCLWSHLSSPPTQQKRNIRKLIWREVEVSEDWSQPLNLSCLSASSGEEEAAQEQEEERPSKSHLEKVRDKRGFYQLSCPDPPGKVCKRAPARAHQPAGECVEDASPATLSPLASPAPLAERPPLLASTLKSQKEPLFHHPPEAWFWEDPAHRQIEGGGSAFLNPDVRKLLEILITKRAGLKLWKDKEKKRSFLKQMSPDYPQGSLGNMANSPSWEWDTTTPHHFWNVKDKPEQLQGPQRISHPKAVVDHLQQKCGQLFWGLPSLHSESLVAAAWISRKSSSKPTHLSVSFNEVPDFFPAENWSEEPSQPPQSKGDPTGSCKTTCPTSQEKAQFLIPTESEHLEWPLQKRLRWKKMLSSLLKNSRAAQSQPTPKLPQDSQDSQSHKSASVLLGDLISPEHQEQHKQHIQRSFIPDKDQLGPPCRSHVPRELMQPQGEFPGKGQPGAEDKHGAFAGERSKDEQKMGSRHSERFSQEGSISVKEDKDPSRNLGQDLKRVPEDPYIDSRNTLVKILEDKEEEESDTDWIRLQRYKSGNYLPGGPEKQQVEKTLNFQLDQKLGEINEGMVPVRAHQSMINASHAGLKSDTHHKPRNLASLRGQKCHVNTSQELFFLDPCTQQMLEAHIIRFRVRHRWGSNLQSLEPINLEGQSPPFPLSSLPSWATGEFGDDAIPEVANFLGEHPWKGLGEKVITKKSVLTLTGFLSAPSPVSEEVQRDLRGDQSGDNHEHSEASSTGQEGRWPSQPLTCSLVNRTWESSTVLGARRGSPEPSPSPAMARHDLQEEKESMASGVPCSSIAMPGLSIGSQSSRAEKPMEPAEGKEEKPPAWDVILGASVMADSQTINVNLGSGSLGTSKSSSFSRISGTQDPGEPCLKTKVVNKFSFKVEVESEDQLQGPATGVLLQDCATGLHFRGRHTDILPTADMLVSQEPQSNSQAPLSGTQSVPSKDASTSQGLRDPTWHGGSSQGQQEPRSPKVRASWKTQSNMFGPNDERESCRRPKPSKHEPRSAGPRPFQSSGMSHPAQVRERETFGNKYSQLPQEKGQAPPESYFRKRINRFLQHLKPNKKGKEQGDPLQKKGKPASATAQSPGQAMRSSMSSRAAEIRAVVAFVRQILVDKLGLRQGHGPPEFNFRKEAPVDGRSCYPKGPYHPGQRRAMRDIASSHATPMGHCYLVKNKWDPDQPPSDRFFSMALTALGKPAAQERI